MKIKDPRSTAPAHIERGDAFIYIVKVMVGNLGETKVYARPVPPAIAARIEHDGMSMSGWTSERIAAELMPGLEFASKVTCTYRKDNDVYTTDCGSAYETDPGEFNFCPTCGRRVRYDQ